MEFYVFYVYVSLSNLSWIDLKKTYEIQNSWAYLTRNWPEISQTLSLLGIAIITWTLGRILLPEYTALSSAPTRMAVLFIGGQLLGIVLRLLNWPEMLGMIGFGMLFTNFGYANFNGYSELEAFFRYTSHFIFIFTILFCASFRVHKKEQKNLNFNFCPGRDLALVNIMLLAGMGIDLQALVVKLWPVLRLSILPTVGEVLIIAVIAKYVLVMPFVWSFLLG